jgi:hypothetical protein
MQLRLLVRETKDEAAKQNASAERHAPSARPTLNVIQGGAPRRPRPARSAARLAVAPAPRTRMTEQLEEVPVYLRPIPSWVPRLW